MGGLQNIREESAGVLALLVIGPRTGAAAAYRRCERRVGDREEA